MHENSIEFEVTAPYGLFSDPITRVGGEKCTYQIPTYEALKGVVHSIYWKPTLIWVVDKVRVMNRIQTETKGIRTIRWAKKDNNEGNTDLSYYTYLKDCRYRVKAHFVWNLNRPELECDRNENKHFEIAKRCLEKGGRRDIFLGARECQAYVEPCKFDEGVGFYDGMGELAFGTMYHGITYPDEAYSEDTQGKFSVRLFNAVMRDGIIEFPAPSSFPRPQDGMVNGKVVRVLRDMKMKKFDVNNVNISEEV